MKKKLKRVISAALTCAMMLTTASAALSVTGYADSTISATTASKSYKIKKNTVTCYFQTVDTKFDNNIFFVNGTDIPYLDMSDYLSIMNTVYTIAGYMNMDFKLENSADGDLYTLKRENGYECVMDFANDIIYFSDYNEFTKIRQEYNLVDGQYINLKDEEGNPIYIKRGKKGTNERYGDMVKMDLGAYGIDIIHEGDNYYLPIQTFSDIFLSIVDYSIFYNGKDLFVCKADGSTLYNDKLTPLGEIYYNKNCRTKKFSKALTEYNYRELCFILDYKYGLKDRHKIESFDQLFYETGLRDELLSRNAARMDAAVYKLISDYLDDQHSKYGMPSYATGYDLKDKLRKKYGRGLSFEASADNLKAFEAARAKFYPDGVPGYEEIGNTAFITFDDFTFDFTPDFYTNAPTNDPNNTISLISYSVQQILRSGSPIKNVVIDLSCNEGGLYDGAIYTIGAFLGKAKICIEDTMTGATTTSVYYVDTNFDKKFNSKDVLAGKGLNLYCLTSDSSFSCGNLVPCIFKQSPDVAVIGQTSGGGACIINNLSTATGTIFRISGTRRSSLLKNGSFYDIDQGVEPDYVLSKKESFYDREKLAEYINSLL